MFLAKLIVVVALVGAASCAVIIQHRDPYVWKFGNQKGSHSFSQKWPRPPKNPWSSEESISRSLSSEEYVGAQQPPLVLGGVPLPTPVHATGVFVDPVYVQKVNPLASATFSDLIKSNKEVISSSIGPNQK